MAVEAHHNNLFPSQLLTNREITKPSLLNGVIYNNAQMDSNCGLLTHALPPTMADSALPFYQSAVSVCNPIASAKTSMNKADSGLSNYIQAPPTRKRSRDFIADFTNLPLPQKNKLSDNSSLLNHQILYQIHNQQSDIDRFIAQHTEKVRMEMEEQRLRQSRMLLSAIEDAVMKKMKEKDEEIQRVGKVNWALQERVKNLCVENQIWRELAQTNQAAANSLRSNLEQVLAHVTEDRHIGGRVAVEDPVADDAQSSCGSNNGGERILDTAATGAVCGGDNDGDKVDCGGSGWMCRKCGVRESIVLLLPCRHLCLCTVCGSTIHDCPVCHSGINASVHVNFS